MTTSNETIKAYRYYPALFNDRRFDVILEYYIPDYHLCFNEQKIMKLDHPQHQVNYEFTHTAAALTTITISKSLADALQLALNNIEANTLVQSAHLTVSPHDANPELKSNDEYQQLIGHSIEMSKKMENGSVYIDDAGSADDFKHADSFKEAYQRKG